MTDFVDTSLIDFDPKDPLTSESMKMVRDNPLAIAEGSDDAPIVRTGWYPYDWSTIGQDSNTGQFYDIATNGAVASIETPTFDFGWEYLLVIEALTHNLNNSVNPIHVDLYNYNTSTWVNSCAKYDYLMDTGTLYSEMVISQPRVFRKCHFIDGHNSYATYINDGVTVGASRIDFSGQYYNGSGSRVSKARIRIPTAVFNAGTLSLYKRGFFTT